MAIFEQHREDLLADATKFAWRLSLRVPLIYAMDCPLPEDSDTGADAAPPTPVFWGQERSERWSLYVGEDLVLHFDEHNLLRRVFLDGRKLAAAAGMLEEVSRAEPERRGGKLRLTRRVLPPEEANALIARFQSAIQELCDRLPKWNFEIAGQFPPTDSSVIQRYASSLKSIANGNLAVARSV
ncbi:MAG: hypothetical protein AB8B50_21530 [Pirellulaceae bacterium]